MGVTSHEQMYMVRHDFHFDQFMPPAFNLLHEDNLQSFIYRRHEYLAPIRRAKDDVIPTDVGDVVVAAPVFHIGSINNR